MRLDRDRTIERDRHRRALAVQDSEGLNRIGHRDLHDSVDIVDPRRHNEAVTAPSGRARAWEPSTVTGSGGSLQ